MNIIIILFAEKKEAPFEMYSNRMMIHLNVYYSDWLLFLMMMIYYFHQELTKVDVQRLLQLMLMLLFEQVLVMNEENLHESKQKFDI